MVWICFHDINSYVDYNVCSFLVGSPSGFHSLKKGLSFLC